MRYYKLTFLPKVKSLTLLRKPSNTRRRLSLRCAIKICWSTILKWQRRSYLPTERRNQTGPVWRISWQNNQGINIHPHNNSHHTHRHLSKIPAKVVQVFTHSHTAGKMFAQLGEKNVTIVECLTTLVVHVKTLGILHIILTQTMKFLMTILLQTTLL